VKAILIAGGFGTRLKEITKQIAIEHANLYNNASDIPKPMVLIDGIPVLEREIIALRNQGINKIILTVSYLANVIEDYFGDGSGVSRATGEPFGCSISYYEEDIPLGNAGALYKVYDQLSDPDDEYNPDDFLLLIADSVFDVDFRRFISYHRAHHALATLFTHPNSHPYDSSIVVTDTLEANAQLYCVNTTYCGMRSSASGSIMAWLNKEDERTSYYKNNVNAGLHIINRCLLDIAVNEGRVDSKMVGKADADGRIVKVDLDRQLLKPLAGRTDSNGYAYLFAYSSPEYVKDMGTIDRYNTTVMDYKNGKVGAKNLRRKQRAIFLDRDGTINNYVGFLHEATQLTLVEGVAEAIRRINASGFLAIVITNQPVIARGETSLSQLTIIHNKMETLLGDVGAYIDGLYYCPHHPDSGYPGEISELKISCGCRKPKTGLVDQAVSDFNIDLGNSYFFGDGQNDIVCGINAGVKSTAFYIGPGSETAVERKKVRDYGQSYTVKSLNDFLDFLGI
jgi:D-glycero-D-manno-heptose 1,7-bisphosphate phosphatase